MNFDIVKSIASKNGDRIASTISGMIKGYLEKAQEVVESKINDSIHYELEYIITTNYKGDGGNFDPENLETVISLVDTKNQKLLLKSSLKSMLELIVKQNVTFISTVNKVLKSTTGKNLSELLDIIVFQISIENLQNSREVREGLVSNAHLSLTLLEDDIILKPIVPNDMKEISCKELIKNAI